MWYIQVGIRLNHRLQDQSLLRLPLELQRRNFKKAQTVIDHEQKTTTALLKDAANKANSAGRDDTLNSIDAMIARMEKLKRKLEVLHAEEQVLHDQSAKRIHHLQELYHIPSLVDVKYESWSKTRLDRLTVDFLLRAGYSETASALATSKGIEHLIDLDTFTSCHKIADSIQRGDTTEALAWVRDNRESIKKLLERSNPPSNAAVTTAPKISPLEFQLRFQEYIELLRQYPRRQTARYEALNYAQKHLYPQSIVHPDQICTVAGLLSQDPSTSAGPYEEYFAPTRWTYLSNLFIETHHNLLNLPLRSGLHVALSAGLSALKTPACHSALNPASAATTGSDATFAPTTGKGSNGIGQSLCPICSMELNSLALSVPYAHHTKSSVENDPMMLPNHRVYGKERLLDLERKKARIDLSMFGSDDDLATTKGRKIQDPVTGDEFNWDDLKKVYIT